MHLSLHIGALQPGCFRIGRSRGFRSGTGVSTGTLLPRIEELLIEELLVFLSLSTLLASLLPLFEYLRVNNILSLRVLVRFVVRYGLVLLQVLIVFSPRVRVDQDLVRHGQVVKKDLHRGIPCNFRVISLA